jgi:hypothetical protein
VRSDFGAFSSTARFHAQMSSLRQYPETINQWIEPMTRSTVAFIAKPDAVNAFLVMAHPQR